MIRKPSRNRMREYAVVTALSLLIVWFIFLIYGIARKEEIARHAVRDTQAELANLESRRETLQQDNNDLGTERGQEAVLRQTYGVAKPGEQVIIVVPPKVTLPPPPEAWWQKVMGWFGL